MAMETGLIRWFRNSRRKNLPVNKTFLLQKAEELAKKNMIENFIPSKSWLLNWKRDFNISDSEWQVSLQYLSNIWF